MALYAYDGECLTYAGEAEERKPYRCAECHKTVRLRKGPFRLPHFYHASLSPSCRLYSKSQDHLLAQLSLQKLLPAGETRMEQPFPSILRVADLVWESRKIIFEVQCSLLSPREAENRMLDYSSCGYQVVWILDDRIFNRRRVNPAELVIRQTPSYYATLRKQIAPHFYDQFEIIHKQIRVETGKSLNVQLQKPSLLPQISWPDDRFPTQVVAKSARSKLYFKGDLLHKALLSHHVMVLACTMQNFRALEKIHAARAKPENAFKRFIIRWSVHYFGLFMLYLLKKAVPQRRLK